MTSADYQSFNKSYAVCSWTITELSYQIADVLSDVNQRILCNNGSHRDLGTNSISILSVIKLLVEMGLNPFYLSWHKLLTIYIMITVCSTEYYN